ncbi:MAG: hypothetical protein QXF23_00655 [Candidatus Bathyarchaeia archaeon]
MVDIWLPYGKTEVHARISSENLMEIAEVHREPGLGDAAKEIEKAIEGATLPDIMSRAVQLGGKIVLALNVPEINLAKYVVSSVIRVAEKVGVKIADLVVLHMKNSFIHGITHNFEGISPLGVNIVTHDPFNGNIYICDIGSGVKVYLNRTFYEANAKIVASTFEPNPYTLYNCCESGLTFGLTGIETIKGILNSILDVEDLQERLFNEAIEVAKIAKIDFSISIVRSFSGEVIKCFAGEPEETLHGSLNVADSLYKVSFTGRPDVIIISPGGAPFDNNLLSACGCLENAIKIVKKNGFVILVAECSEGYGETGFHQMVKRVRGDLKILEEVLRSDFNVNGFIFYRFLRALKKANLAMVSAVPDYYASEIPGLKIFRSVNDALNNALSKLGAKAKITVVPHGNFIIPVIKE